MKRIHEYPLRIEAEHVLDLSPGAVLLDAQLRDGQLVLWAEVDPDGPVERRKVMVFGTGFELPDVPRRHVATVQRGALVLHVYDGGRA